MYDDNINQKYFNVTIDGLPLIAYDHSPSESFNRRETSRKSIIGGTEDVKRTSYVHRDITFHAKVKIDPLYPHIYDSTFMLWQSKSVEVISNEFGGKFNAECIIKKTHETPAYLHLEIQLIEIPGEDSNIPDDKFIVPAEKVVETKVTRRDNKGSNKNSNRNTRNTRNNRNRNRNRNSRNRNTKGGKITTTKKNK